MKIDERGIDSYPKQEMEGGIWTKEVDVSVEILASALSDLSSTDQTKAMKELFKYAHVSLIDTIREVFE